MDKLKRALEILIISCSAKFASPGSTAPASGSTLKSRLEIFVFVSYVHISIDPIFVFYSEEPVVIFLLVSYVYIWIYPIFVFFSEDLNSAQFIMDLIVRCPRTTLAPSAVTPRLVASLLFTPSTMSGSGLTANSNTIKFEEF